MSLQLATPIKIRYTTKFDITYWHKAIVSTEPAGDEASIKVIHFSLPEGQTEGECEVVETSLKWFLDRGRDPAVEEGEPIFSPQQIVKRARSQLGKKSYDLPTRNCKHFTTWCWRGSAFSQQVHEYGFTAVVCGVISAVLIAVARVPWS